MRTAIRLFMCALFMSAGFVPSLFGQTSSKREITNNEAEKLLNIERKLSEAIAKRDTKLLDQIYADDFRGLTSYGYETDKAKLMQVFKEDDSKIKFTIDDLLTRVFKDTAIVTGRHTGKTADGEVVSRSRFIHVYMKRSGRWQMVAGQGTSIRAE